MQAGLKVINYIDDNELLLQMFVTLPTHPYNSVLLSDYKKFIDYKYIVSLVKRRERQRMLFGFLRKYFMKFVPLKLKSLIVKKMSKLGIVYKT
jgi:hypothetical protein